MLGPGVRAIPRQTNANEINEVVAGKTHSKVRPGLAPYSTLPVLQQARRLETVTALYWDESSTLNGKTGGDVLTCGNSGGWVRLIHT